MLAATWRLLTFCTIAICLASQVLAEPPDGPKGQVPAASKPAERSDSIVEDPATNPFEDVNELIRLNPKDARNFFRRATMFDLDNDADKALLDLNEAIRLDPKYALAYNNRGYAWRQKGEFDNALKDCNQAISLEPGNAILYGNRGSVWVGKREFANAVKDFIEAIGLDPKDANCYDAIATLRATSLDDRTRAGKEAIEYATKACELTEWKSSRTVGTLAAAYAEAGDFMNAIKWQEKSIEMALKMEKPETLERLDLYKANKPFRADASVIREPSIPVIGDDRADGMPPSPTPTTDPNRPISAIGEDGIPPSPR